MASLVLVVVEEDKDGRNGKVVRTDVIRDGTNREHKEEESHEKTLKVLGCFMAILQLRYHLCTRIHNSLSLESLEHRVVLP